MQPRKRNTVERNAEARARAAQRGQARAAIAEMRRLLAMAEAGEPAPAGDPE